MESPLLSTGRSANGLNKTMSLSMKLRAESATMAMSRPSTTQNLPRLIKSRTGNIHIKPPTAKSDVSKLYERLSGSFETAAYESFPFQETICHPTTLCVRCANHASLCVPCADTLSQEAVEFFRRSQALGAYHLFNGAIKQAGGEKVLRFVIFRCWKNSIRLRKYGRVQRHGRTEKRYIDLILRDPFRAWVKFTRECQHDRREKKEQQLEERIKVLEQQLNKYVAEKSNTDKQIRLLQVAKSDADDEIRKLKSMLKESEEVIQEERARVLKITKIVEEFSPRLLDAIKLSIEATLATTLRHINLTSHFHQSSLNLSRLAKSTKSASSSSSSSSSSSTRKSTLSKGALVPETGPIPRDGSSGALLLSWLNSISKSLSGQTITATGTGHSLLLDDFLPSFQELKSLETLKNGQQVSRVIFRLITQSLSKSPSSLLITPSSSMTLSSSSSSSTPSSSSAGQASNRSTRRNELENKEKKSITLEKMNQLKELQSTPHEFYPLVVEYLQNYFPSFPSLPLDRILAGKIDSIEFFITELLFIWCGLDGHSLFIDERNEIQKLTEKQHHHLSEINRAFEELHKTKLFHLGLRKEEKGGEGEGGEGEGKEGKEGNSHERYEEKKEEKSAITSSTAASASATTSSTAVVIKPISFDISRYLPDSIYENISTQIDDYFHKKSSDDFFKLFSELIEEIQTINEFVNTVYLKEKLASNGLHYLIDSQRLVGLGCVQNMITIEGEYLTELQNQRRQNKGPDDVYENDLEEQNGEGREDEGKVAS